MPFRGLCGRRERNVERGSMFRCDVFSRRAERIAPRGGTGGHLARFAEEPRAPEGMIRLKIDRCY